MTTPAEELRAAAQKLREAEPHVAALLAAREPLAAWFDEIAAEAERWEAAGRAGRLDEIVGDDPIAVARAINGGQRTRDGAP